MLRVIPRNFFRIYDLFSLSRKFSDSSGSSWSNIPRCFQNPDSCITASVLSSDAGISSMPSSMISNISEEASNKHATKVLPMYQQPKTVQDLSSGPYSLPTPDVLKENELKEIIRHGGRPRSQEKGLASKRAELLAENPIRPNTNVGSKLKEILAEKNMNINPKKNRDKPKGKWDAIMCQISSNKQIRSSEPKLKEVRSKVFADFKPPKLIRHQSVNGSKQKISVDKRSLPSRSNSTLSSNGLLGM